LTKEGWPSRTKRTRRSSLPPACRSLSPELQHLLHFRNDFAITTLHVYTKLAVNFLFTLQRFANFIHLLFRDPKMGINRPPPRLAESNHGRFIPNNVVPSQNLDEHHHVKRIRHRIKQSPVLRTDIIRIPSPPVH